MDKLVGWHGAGVNIALVSVDVSLSELFDLLLRFNAFGNDIQSLGSGELNDCFQDGSLCVARCF